MAEPQIEFAYPCAWPHGRRQTTARQSASWRHQGGRVNWDVAIGRLREQVGLVTRHGSSWRVLEQTLSTDYELRLDGRPRRDRGAPAFPGVAFYFELDGQPHVLACDRWDTVPDNIAAIAAHIEALRGQERWGVADLKQAFAGHAALPAPEQWWQILGLSSSATIAEIDAAWRAMIAAAHPDRQGGSDAELQEIDLADLAALAARADLAARAALAARADLAARARDQIVPLMVEGLREAIFLGPHEGFDQIIDLDERHAALRELVAA